MAKEAKLVSIIEMQIIPEVWQEHILAKKFEDARCVYNSSLGILLNRYNEIRKTKEFRADQEKIVEYYKNKTGKMPDGIKAIFDKRNQLYKENQLTQFGVNTVVLEQSKYYQKNIPSNVASVTVAEALWRALNTLIYGNGKSVTFKRTGSINALASNNKSGIRFIEREDGYFVIFSNIRAHAKTLEIPVKKPKNIYEDDMMHRNIRITRVIRKKEGNKYHYYVQLCVDGAPYLKLDNNGNNVRKFGEGSVGLFLKGNTLYAVSSKGTKKWDLTAGRPDITNLISEIDRKKEEILRLNNPDNYNDDGTPIKGRRKWVRSAQYNELQRKKNEAKRKDRESRKIYYNCIANEILALGTDIHMQKTSFLKDKPKYSEEEKLSNKEYKIKKERRKRITDHAPAELFAIINRKLVSYAYPCIHEKKYNDDDYFYCHDKSTHDKSRFTSNLVELNHNVYNANYYRALCAIYYDNEKKKFDNEMIKKHMGLLTAAI